MKTKLFFTGLIAWMAFFSASAQNYKADDVLGEWLNEEKDGKIEIYKENGKYFGKLIWLKDPIDEETNKPKTDDENPDPKLRNRPLKGLVIMKDFVFDNDDEWNEGTIYDPKSGNTYSCYMTYTGPKELKVKGYIGVSWIGRSTYWTKVK